MKTIKIILILLVLFATSVLNAQNPKASQWTVDKCTKITAKITKDLTLSKEDSVKFINIIIDKYNFEIQKLKGVITTPEEKSEIYKVSGEKFVNNLNSSFPKELSSKIRAWWNNNYKTFNSL